MSLTQLTPPALQPVTLAEAKLHLKVDANDEDLLITAAIVAATEMAEQITGRAIMPQSWKLSLPAFHAALEITRVPVISITSLVYDDANGAPQTLAGTEYVLDNANDYSPAYVIPAFGKCWPTTRSQVNSVRLTYQAGYANAAVVPESIKSWIKLAVGSMYENRQAEVIERGAVLSLGFADRLLDRYKVWAL
jgi:uncharacterized phiE125 gp8 family phage protein